MTRIRAFLLTLVLLLITRPAPAGTEFQLRSLTLNVAGLNRQALVWAPAQPEPGKRYRLIFAWHGAGGRAERFRNYAGLENETGADAVIVYPQGLPTERPQHASGWMLERDSRDMRFYDSLLTTLKQAYPVDEKRVFSYGFSFGAYFSHALACGRGKQLRGIAAHAGGGPYFKPCQGPVAALLAHARDDEVVPFARGTESLNHYLKLNGCRQQTQPWQAGVVSYSGCQQPLLWLGLSQGGHGIPENFPALAWRFFSSL